MEAAPTTQTRHALRWVLGVGLVFVVVSTGAMGILTHALDSRDDVTYPPPGSTWSFQFMYRDPAGGPSGINLTNAVEVTPQ